MVFQGRAALTLDGKGRMTMPARHRDALHALCAGRLVLTKHLDDCLWLFPQTEWEAFRDKLVALPLSASAIKRLYLGSAMEVELDGSSRVLIAPELRAAAGLERDLMLLGMGDRFEIWDAQRLEANEATLKNQPHLLEGLAL